MAERSFTTGGQESLFRHEKVVALQEPCKLSGLDILVQISK
jgi:hypothetical protein